MFFAFYTTNFQRNTADFRINSRVMLINEIPIVITIS